MLGAETLQGDKQFSFIVRLALGFIAMARSRLPEDFTGPAFGDGELLADMLHATPSPRRA